MRIDNFVQPEELLGFLNLPEFEAAEHGRRVEDFVRAKGQVSPAEADLLWDREVAGWLRSYIDEWLATGFRRDGKEYPFRRHPFKMNRAKDALLEYLDSYSPKVTLDAREGLLITIGAPSEPSLDWTDFFTAAVTEARRYFAAFIMNDGLERLGKCPRCRRYFLGRARDQGYKHGRFCCTSHARAPSAIAATNARRLRIDANLVEFAAACLTKMDIRGAAWMEDKKLRTRLAERVHNHLWQSKNPELMKYRARFPLKRNWITSHREKIERARLRTLSRAPVGG